ncbi:isoprenylcysteine carboxylmethyltransferase family protein [Candidatus Peribacteria bacterium]|nr:isoprenylcysteine carboxylmethyltransferase family protein [Candidatus Peribacteria bacterium]
MSSFRNIIPIGSLILGIILAVTLHFNFPLQTVISEPWTLLGIPLIVFGILQFGFSVSHFVRHKTDIRPSGKPTSLIMSGPFRYTRNPIYLANIIVLLGVCLLLGSVASFIVIPLYFIIVNSFIVPFEEEMLVSVFTERYQEYKKRVRRWL